MEGLPPPQEKRRASREELEDFEKNFRHILKTEKLKKKEWSDKNKPWFIFLNLLWYIALPVSFFYLLGVISVKQEVGGGESDRHDKCIDNRGSYDC